MAYRFKHEESFGDGLHRIGAEQFKQISGGLETAPVPAAVHAVRKCIKRLRALLQLVRPGIGEAGFKRENVRLRDAARLLSGARDRTVLASTIVWLEQHADDADQAAFDVLRAQLSSDQPSPEEIDAASLDRVRWILAKAEQGWMKLRLEPASLAPLIAGLGHVHQRCAHAFDVAYGKESDEAQRDHAFHDWRKAVQQHWRHMRLLERGWPDYMTARAALANELSDLLGTAQDLTLLVGHIERVAAADGSGLTSKQARRLIALARRQQQALRNAARTVGERLLAEGTAGHVRRISLYWTTAEQIRPLEAVKAVRTVAKHDTPAAGIEAPGAGGEQRAAALRAKSSNAKSSSTKSSDTKSPSRIKPKRTRSTKTRSPGRAR